MLGVFFPQKQNILNQWVNNITRNNTRLVNKDIDVNEQCLFFISDVKNVETNLIWTMSFLSDVSDVKSVETPNLYD